MSRCRVCGRTLTNPASISRGIGPKCTKDELVKDRLLDERDESECKYYGRNYNGERKNPPWIPVDWCLKCEDKPCMNEKELK